MRKMGVKENIFVIGGCRSGKSRHALELSEKISDIHRVFIATCVPYDEEMKDRVRRHRQDRDSSWATVDAPVELADAILKYSQSAHVILADCLTLWMSNLLMESENMENRVEQLTVAINQALCPVIIVSNEVGTGIVPTNALARQYRDAVGYANQKVAACVDRVIWMVAGIPVLVKE
jgi:adenosylcobinamide kinase / adenosylcobinamide-phosphate guanylyltransferase